MLARMRRKRISFALLVGMQAGAATRENSVEVPQKTKKRTTLRPSHCTTRHLSTGYRCAVLKGHVHPHVYSSTINNSQSMEKTKMSIDGWMDKEDVVHIYNGVLLGNQKEWNLASCNYVELEGIMLSEISQRQIKIIWLHSYEDFMRQNMNIREGKEK